MALKKLIFMGLLLYGFIANMILASDGAESSSSSSNFGVSDVYGRTCSSFFLKFIPNLGQ